MPAVLGVQLGMIGALILHRRCTCPNGASSMIPVWHLVERYGGGQLLGDILLRLVCRRCRRRPRVILSDSMHTEPCGGPPPGWSVVLAEAS